MHCYKLRILRLEGAPLLRLRWYGENDGEVSKNVYVETKTHHEGWVGESSVKQRFVIPQGNVWAFISLNFDVQKFVEQRAKKLKASTEGKEIKEITRLATEATQLIGNYKLRPMIRTSYSRCAFQHAVNNEVRFSLDANLCMLDEYATGPSPEDIEKKIQASGDTGHHLRPPWARAATDALSKDQLVRFPYAVLEVKLAAEVPQWVSHMLEGCEALAVHKFSKFQHGIGLLHGKLVEEAGAHFPHWFEDFHRKGYGTGFGPMGGIQSLATDVCIRGGVKPPAKMPTDLAKRLLDTRYSAETHFGSFKVPIQSPPDDNNDHNALQPLSGGMGIRKKGLIRIEPKSFFAAERVFLHYVNHAIYLGSLSTVLYEIGTKWTRAAGLIMSPVSLALLLYAFCVFKERTQTIRDFRPTSRFDHETGPVVIFFLMAVALVATFLLNLTHDSTFIVKKVNMYKQ
eukprot:GHVR01087034.1.p1 GENE.GHVR01087034.1~~GHVR01087034.1.p1  ORF type:complete len:456 (-),score=87.51 GHVR01087034.1:90-1457(-)